MIKGKKANIGKVLDKMYSKGKKPEGIEQVMENAEHTKHLLRFSKK